MDFAIFLKPVVTEKATQAQAEGKYQFFVQKHATKIDVRNAFEKLYGVKISKINVMTTAGKTRTGKTRKPITKKHELKKIIVTIKGKKTLDLNKPSLKY